MLDADVLECEDCRNHVQQRTPPEKNTAKFELSFTKQIKLSFPLPL